ncbi:SNF-related serine/threonine-protein kinase-like protein [Lates japonicus]|uniref:non-specific serine/threonine protein kinase n=1 Tax=Lates japonicus TaxID=270547 RepID=A0AAD3NNJ5_LATJO|nr:SNF-related serine/threonine-protein kinase-like protein [Lates japonicus]
MAGLKRHHDGKIAGLYDLDKTLGRGHFAVVKLARHVFTGEKVAVKVIDKTKLDPVARGHLFQEVRCMKMVQHPNVVRLYEVIDTATKLYLILELGDGGDMYDCIMKHDGGLSEEVAKCYFAQIVHAISYCHRLHVVHRDLKPENVVFFEKQGVVKLTDFGFSNRFQPGKKLNTSCGSLAYSAPEILLGDEYDAPAVVQFDVEQAEWRPTVLTFGALRWRPAQFVAEIKRLSLLGSLKSGPFGVCCSFEEVLKII